MNYATILYDLDRYVYECYGIWSEGRQWHLWDDDQDLFHANGCAYVLDMLPKGGHKVVTTSGEKREDLGSFVISRIPYVNLNGKKRYFYLATSILPKSSLIYQTVFYTLKFKFPDKEASPVFIPQGSLKSLSVIIPSKDRDFYGFVVGVNPKNLEYYTITLKCPYCKRNKPVEDFTIAKLEYPDTENFVKSMKIKRIIDMPTPGCTFIN